MIETRELEEKVVLIGVATGDERETRDSLEELAELLKTAGAIPAATIIQNREAIHPGTYIGKGKIVEVKEMIAQTNATGIVCDDELSPVQFKNLENELQIKIMDRTMVILDIFARHAVTREGKIQVELAQLRYRLSRLTGMGTSLSRLGGGIGTRGPGEKKLEVDRRHIRERIGQLKKELEEVKKAREENRKKRKNQKIPVVAIVGYTNAGKSTLLNKLTNAGVLEEDKLFATLDPTTRLLPLESGQQLLFTDTVGFIRKLPHHLVEAFRSTLEEAKYADIIVHVVDISNPDAEKQMYVVYDTLAHLEVGNKTVITAFNKCDLPSSGIIQKDLRAESTVHISAKTGEGLEALLKEIEAILREQKILIEKIIPYEKAGTIEPIRKYGELLTQEYKEDGIYIKAYVPKDFSF